MRMKIIGIFVCMLLIETVLPPIGSINEQVNEKKLVTSNIPLAVSMYVKVEGIDGESTISAGLKIIITNIGDEIINDIDWNLTTSDGIIIFGDGKQGSRLPLSLYPTDETEVILRPVPRLFPDADGYSPIGFGNVNMKLLVQGTVGSTLETSSATSKAFLLGPFVINIKEI